MLLAQHNITSPPCVGTSTLTDEPIGVTHLWQQLVAAVAARSATATAANRRRCRTAAPFVGHILWPVRRRCFCSSSSCCSCVYVCLCVDAGSIIDVPDSVYLCVRVCVRPTNGRPMASRCVCVYVCERDATARVH